MNTPADRHTFTEMLKARVERLDYGRVLGVR